METSHGPTLRTTPAGITRIAFVSDAASYLIECRSKVNNLIWLACTQSLGFIGHRFTTALLLFIIGLLIATLHRPPSQCGRIAGLSLDSKGSAVDSDRKSGKDAERPTDHKEYKPSYLHLLTPPEPPGSNDLDNTPLHFLPRKLSNNNVNQNWLSY